MCNVVLIVLALLVPDIVLIILGGIFNDLEFSC